MTEQTSNRRAAVVHGGPDKPSEPGSDAGNFATLVEAVAQAGCRRSFASLFEHFAPRLKSFYRGQGVADAHADELVQECMLTLWRRAGDYRPERAAVSTWLFTIARNLGIDRLRKERRFEPDTPPEEALLNGTEVADAMREVAPEEFAASSKREAALHRALLTLPVEQRRVVDLHFGRWMSTAEIATHEAVSQGTVKSRIRLALGRLRNQLEDD